MLHFENGSNGLRLKFIDFTSKRFSKFRFLWKFQKSFLKTRIRKTRSALSIDYWVKGHSKVDTRRNDLNSFGGRFLNFMKKANLGEFEHCWPYEMVPRKFLMLINKEERSKINTSSPLSFWVQFWTENLNLSFYISKRGH